MNTPRYAAAAAKFLGRHLLNEHRTPSAADRERSLATIERAIQWRQRRRRLRVGGSLVAVAAGLALALRLNLPTGSPKEQARSLVVDASPSGRGASLKAGKSQRMLAGGAVLEPGQSVETPTDGGASLRLSTGTSLALGGSTSFRVDSQGALQRFSLERGEMSAHVAKLTDGQRFIVATPDVEIEVRGTRFLLRVVAADPACGAGSLTRLEVTEGLVELRTATNKVAVAAGEHWPVGCATHVVVQPTLDPIATRPIQSAHTRGGSSLPPERASTLAPQNDLFAEGVKRRRQGDIGGALRAYQELLVQYPRSGLAENALVERMRILASANQSSAATEARRYLKLYPRGFAVEEAQRLAATP